MNSTYPMYLDVARLEVSQRLRAADDDRRRRLARHHGDPSSVGPRIRRRSWR